jgi:hypothetical protein
MSHAVTWLWSGDKTRYKPLCLIMQFAGSLFPDGDFDRLSELDRQRLVTFLNWINDPFFGKNGSLIYWCQIPGRDQPPCARTAGD